MNERDDAYERLKVQDLIDWYAYTLEIDTTPAHERASMARTMTALITRRDRIDERIRRRDTPETEPAAN
jgi:hypothetical protein